MNKVGLKSVSIIVAVGLLLSGCTPTMTLSVDGMLEAPKLTSEQTVIHETVIASVGNNISLKYPKNGDNRSAFVITDIDDEKTNEALVFYERNNTLANESGLRVNILDQDENGKWKSVYDLAGNGTDVDRILISKLGPADKKNIIVGYSTMNIDEKTLQISSYDKGEFISSKYIETYSLMEVFDIDRDGFNEIITASINLTDATAQVSLIEAVDSKIVKTDSVSLSANTTSFLSCKVGLVDNETPAIFIDCLKATGEVQTEVIYYKYGKLQNPLIQIPDKLVDKTSRPTGFYSIDIDSDGVVEIPTIENMTGYVDKEDEEMIYLTNWWAYGDYYTLTKKYSGYYNVSGGYAMMFPKRWQGGVTIKKDTSTDEVVFYKYIGSSIDDYMTELMRIAVVTKSSTQQYIHDGYEIIASQGQLDFLVKLQADKKEPLILTMGEIQNSFLVVN
ncbi:MAG: hypothetical protein GX896_04095 [Clostridiales bacterium]|nr:hypothetical protein [Clostridiales bacterium]